MKGSAHEIIIRYLFYRELLSLLAVRFYYLAQKAAITAQHLRCNEFLTFRDTAHFHFLSVSPLLGVNSKQSSYCYNSQLVQMRLLKTMISVYYGY